MDLKAICQYTALIAGEGNVFLLGTAFFTEKYASDAARTALKAVTVPTTILLLSNDGLKNKAKVAAMNNKEEQDATIAFLTPGFEFLG